MASDFGICAPVPLGRYPPWTMKVSGWSKTNIFSVCRIIILNDGPTLYLGMFGATCIPISVAGLSSYTRPHMLRGLQGGGKAWLWTLCGGNLMSRLVYYRLVVLRMVKGVFCLFDNNILIPRNIYCSKQSC